MSSEFDSSDFDELLLQHLVRSPEVLEKAKQLKLTPDDFLSSEIAGIRLYKAVANAIFDIDQAPIERKFLELMVDKKLKEMLLPSAPELKDLYDWFYTAEVYADKFVEILPEFIKHRRVAKIQQAHKEAPKLLYEEVQKLAIDLSFNEVKATITTSNPFEKPTFRRHTQGIPTGFTEIDSKLHGVAKQELGLLIGHSGSGKTAVASVIAKNCALEGFNVLYISLEEPADNIIDRWYANQFRMRYTDLHFGKDSENKGSIQLELERNFAEMSEATRQTFMEHLRIVDARELCPVDVHGIINILEQKADEGFFPDIIFLDQLDYMKPRKKIPSGSQPWMAYEATAFECDSILSQHKIKGHHTFATWVIHQGKGQMKWEFGYDDIAGFRGIVKPFDICLGIGRHDKDNPYINLFSMKTRHTMHFRQSYQAEFAYMSFMKDDWSPAKLKEAEKAKKRDEALQAKKVSTKTFLKSNGENNGDT